MDCGVDGWRWDFVWGYGVEDVAKLIRDTRRKEYFSMGSTGSRPQTCPAIR
jgi:hypothetical protein